VLLGDQPQVPVENADAGLTESQLTQARQDLPIEAVAVGLPGHRRQVDESGVPGLGQGRHPAVGRDLAACMDRRAVRQRCLQGAFGGGLGGPHRSMVRTAPS
jgi:hypothetical protein